MINKNKQFGYILEIILHFSIIVDCIVIIFLITNIKNERVINIFCLIEILLCILEIVTNNYKLKKEKDKNFDLKKENERLENCYDNLRSFKHDFSNILQSMGGYIAIEDLDGLKKMYKSVVNEFNEISNTKQINSNVINNPAIYHLLNQKIAIAEKYGIKINIKCLIDLTKLNITDFEICRMLGIFIDNSIEAAKNCMCKTISIKFEENKRNSSDLIIIENECENNVNINKIYEKDFTTKKNKNGHGLGLWKANQIAKMNKNIEIITENGKKFRQTIVIKKDSSYPLFCKCTNSK